ncbi:MAG: BACON domain-containing protein [Verrucomicrobia bacterium]|nr:BACON domain-containing protein [Verrucomicrobiota bacterium]
MIKITAPTSLKPSYRNALASAWRASRFCFLIAAAVLYGSAAMAAEPEDMKTAASSLAPQPENLAQWTAVRDALGAEKQRYLKEAPAGPAGVEVKTETVPSPIEPMPKYSTATGVEGFEYAWPDCYWFTTGWPTWNDVSCITPYEGSWSAYCAGSSSTCAGYANNMDAVMYTECQYLGLSSSGNNHLYFKTDIPSIESCCDYLEIKVEGYANQPPHGQTCTPTASYTYSWSAATAGWQGWTLTLGPTFDPCLYLRVSFRFHSDASVTYTGAFVDYIEFNNRAGLNAIYPICGGFTAPICPGSCTGQVSPTSGSISACGGSTTTTVIPNLSTCTWTVSNPCSSWLTVSPSSGAGSGTVTFSAGANNTGSSRSCTVTVNGIGWSANYTVTQPSTSIITQIERFLPPKCSSAY